MDDSLSRLKNFILDASRATYASGDETIKQKQPDGSTTFEYKRGEYSYHDNYFGGEPYGGREVVFLNDKPIWMMVYYGFVDANAEKKEVYPFLMRALSNAPAEMPYRGPQLLEDGSWKYENILTGNVDRFSGTERILKDGICVYEASYIGGLVDC
ncbi:MAG: DUF5680 domain-containing protein [Patescibacteria group bacterium]